MTIAQIRSVCQARLSISNRTVAFLNNRRVSSDIEHKAVVRDFDKLEFLPRQKVYAPPQYRYTDSPLRAIKAESNLEPAARWL